MGMDQLSYPFAGRLYPCRLSLFPSRPSWPIHLTSRMESEQIHQKIYPRRPHAACPANSISPHMASPNPNQLTNPNQDRSRLHVDLDPRGGRLWIQAADSHLLGDWEGPTSHGGSLGEKSSFHGTCGNFPGLHGNFVKLHGHEMELDGIT